MQSEIPRPAQRKELARVLTPAGWLVGTFHVPEARPLRAFLDEARPFFTLTDVELAGKGTTLPYLSLARASALLVIPARGEELEEPDRSRANTVVRMVSVLFEGGLLMGRLAVAEGVRVSDALLDAAGFLLLRQCTLGLDRPGEDASVEANPVVLLQASRVVGVSELDAP